LFTAFAKLVVGNISLNNSSNVWLALLYVLPASVSLDGSTLAEYCWSWGTPFLLYLFGTFAVVVVASLVALIWLRSSVNSGASVSFFCSTAIASSCADSTPYGTIVAFSVESGSEDF